jgi:hypothetical protein
MRFLDKTPDHLKLYVKPVNEILNFEHNDWFNELTWKGQLTHDNETYFKISFYGLKCDDGFLINRDNSPLIIYAEDVISNKKILLFDEREHGYNSLLIEEEKFNVIGSDFFYYDYHGDVLFEIFIWTNSSIDFLDEYDFDDNGQTKLISGQTVNLDFLKRNAFDAFGIILKNKNNNCIILTEIELA